MGNYFSQKKRESLNVPLLEFDNIFFENLNSQQIKNYIQLLKNEVTECINSNQKLEDKIEELHKSYKTNIYNLNEQINLINKDLETLLQNDKCLLQKYNLIKSNIDSNEETNYEDITDQDNNYVLDNNSNSIFT